MYVYTHIIYNVRFSVFVLFVSVLSKIIQFCSNFQKKFYLGIEFYDDICFRSANEIYCFILFSVAADGFLNFLLEFVEFI